MWFQINSWIKHKLKKFTDFVLIISIWIDKTFLNGILVL